MSIRTQTTPATALGAFADDRRGAAAIVMAILTPILIAGLAFGAEVGFWELQRRKLQNAVDTAAYAAGTQLRSGVTDEAELKTFAKSVAEAGGYAAGEAGVTVATPPASGAYAGNVSAVRVTLAHSIPRRFSRLYDSSPVEFTVQSTALVENGRPACILALSHGAPNSIVFAANSEVELEGCDVAANSIASNAIHLNSGAELDIECMSAVGGIKDDGADLELNDCGAPIENAAVTPDPYSNLTKPTAVMGQSCRNVDEWEQENGEPQANERYCGGATINDRLGRLDPGVYVFDGGDWRFTDNAEVEGENVTFVFTGGARLFIEEGAKFNLDAQDKGSEVGGGEAGVVLYFDPDDGQIEHRLLGEGGMSLTGVVYAPKADLKFASNTSSGTGSGGCAQIIANTISFESANADFESECEFSGKRDMFSAGVIRLVE